MLSRMSDWVDIVLSQHQTPVAGGRGRGMCRSVVEVRSAAIRVVDEIEVDEEDE